MQLYVVAIPYAAWLFLINFVFYHVHGAVPGPGALPVEAAVLAGIVPMAIQIFVLGFNPLGMRRPVNVLLAFLVIVLAGYLANGRGWLGFQYLVLFLYIGFGTVLMGGCPDRRLLATIAVLYSLSTAVWLLDIDLFGTYLWGRLDSGLQSNVWGLFAVSVGASAFAHRSRATGGFCFAVAAFTMYEASSRSSMLGLLVASVIIGLHYLARLKNRPLVMAFALISVTLIAAAPVVPVLHHAVIDFVNNVWKVDDPQRGFGTGASGRAALWQDAIDIWWQHPLLGVGYRMHQLYMPDQIESHDSYIAMLADTGICGLVWYMALLAVVWRNMFRVADPRLRYFAAALTISYTCLGLFERRTIDGANSTSWLFVIVVILVLRDSSIAHWRRVSERAASRDGGLIYSPARAGP